MPTEILSASNVQSADSTQGGTTAFGSTSTNSGSTLADNAVTPSARWFNFAAKTRGSTSLKIKFDLTFSEFSNATLTIDYSLNNGSNWTNAFTLTSNDISSKEIVLPGDHNTTQVQLRCKIVETGGGGGFASVSFSNIRIENTYNLSRRPIIFA